MTAPAQKKTRRGGAGYVWMIALEIASALCQGLPWLAIGLAIGVEGRL
jgi:hypothetical protein